MIVALLLACASPPDAPEEATCPAVPLGPGEVLVGPVGCADQRLAGGAGQNRDLWLANSRLRAVLRNPNASLSLAGLGGGTLIDAAPWGRADELLELAPLVDGGWLLVDDLAWADDGVALSGEVRGLPYAPSPSEGERATVTWRIGADDPWLRIDGATGLWLHADDDLDLMDGWLVGERVVYGHDGVIRADLGGALIIDGASGLLVASTDDAWSQRPGPHKTLAGASVGGAELRLLRDGEEVGRVPVTDDVFSATIPVDVDAVRAYAPGRAPSPPAPPGEDLTLPPGAAGSVQVALGWAGQPRPVRVQWVARDGRDGEALLPPIGGRLALGSGSYTLTLDAGPAWAPRTLALDLPPDAALHVSARLTARFDPGPRILADLRWPGHGARSVRDSPNDAVRAALRSGLSYVVVLGDDAVGGAGAWVDDAPWIRFDTGARLNSDDGWTIAAWPWSRNGDRAGWGAPAVRGLSALDALGIAWGGVSTNRFLAVDEAWLRAADALPWATDPRPSHLLLDAPGPAPFAAWQPWFEWLNDGRFLLPSGPTHWLDVEDKVAWGGAELGRAVHLGRYCTGTGALLTVDVGGAGPGGVIPRAEPPPDTAVDTDPAPALPLARLTLHTAGRELDRLGVYVGGVGVVAEWEITAPSTTVEVPVDVPLWAVGVAWSTTTGDWVVTAPVWISPPWGPGTTLPF
jgi:hypothetical protein